jgi:hypothetical protein
MESEFADREAALKALRQSEQSKLARQRRAMQERRATLSLESAKLKEVGSLGRACIGKAEC